MCLPLPASPKQVCNRVSYAMLTPASAPDGNGVPAAAEQAAWSRRCGAGCCTRPARAGHACSRSWRLRGTWRRRSRSCTSPASAWWLPASVQQAELACLTCSCALALSRRVHGGPAGPAEPAALLCCSWRVHKVLAGRLPLTGRLPLAHVWHTHLSELLHKLQRS